MKKNVSFFLIFSLFFFFLASTGWTQVSPDATVRANNAVAGEIVIAPATAKKIQARKYLALNQNPQSPSRQLDWETELAVVLTADSPVIEVTGAGQKKSAGILPAGVLVVVDKTTRTAKWVGVCGNAILTHWVPEGKLIASPGKFSSACERMEKMMAKLAIIETSVLRTEEGMGELLSRPSPLSREETKQVVREVFVEQTLPEPIPAVQKLNLSVGIPDDRQEVVKKEANRGLSKTTKGLLMGGLVIAAIAALTGGGGGSSSSGGTPPPPKI